MRDQWEYMIDRPFGKICTHPPKEWGETGNGNIEKYFNALGEKGWELCGIDDNGYYFKRKIVEEEEILTREDEIAEATMFNHKLPHGEGKRSHG